jgi:biopolymer transport protein ExbD
MLEALMNTLALRQNAAHNVVVLFAVLLTLLAIFAWAQWLRTMTARDGTPLKRPSRKNKAKGTIDANPQ